MEQFADHTQHRRVAAHRAVPRCAVGTSPVNEASNRSVVVNPATATILVLMMFVDVREVVATVGF